MAILKVTLLKINRLLPIHTNNVQHKFGLDIQSQTKGKSPETKKSIVADRRPFWKWLHCKSIGFCPQPKTTCTWNLKLKFQSKLKLCSRNHAIYKVQKQKNPIWLPGSHFENDVIENLQVLCQWSLVWIFKAKLKLKSRNQTIQYGHQAAILKVTQLKINIFCLWPQSTCTWNL